MQRPFLYVLYIYICLYCKDIPTVSKLNLTLLSHPTNRLITLDVKQNTKTLHPTWRAEWLQECNPESVLDFICWLQRARVSIQGRMLFEKKVNPSAENPFNDVTFNDEKCDWA